MPQKPGLPAASASRCFFSADTHLGHRSIIGLCDRPFADVEAMDEAIIANWNSVVTPGDTVYHLGDFCRGGSDGTGKYLSRLNGRVHLVWGNHDKPGVRQMTAWASSGPFVEVEIEGVRLVLCHYGLRTWRGVFRGALHFYGHSHGRMPGDRQCCDVGTDCWGFRPVSLEEIRERLATLPERGCRSDSEIE